MPVQDNNITSTLFNVITICRMCEIVEQKMQTWTPKKKRTQNSLIKDIEDNEP